jgi:hypothetical protein
MKAKEFLKEEGIGKGTNISLKKVEELLEKYGKIKFRELAGFVLPPINKFIDKVESGRARSRETYDELKTLHIYIMNNL